MKSCIFSGQSWMKYLFKKSQIFWPRWVEARVDAHGPLSWGVSLWPHQSGQTRRRPRRRDRVEMIGPPGVPATSLLGIYGPAVLNTTASGCRIISTHEQDPRPLLRYLFRFARFSRFHGERAAWQMTKRWRDGRRAVYCRETDRRLLISPKRLRMRQRWHWWIWMRTLIPLSHTCLLNLKQPVSLA